MRELAQKLQMTPLLIFNFQANTQVNNSNRTGVITDVNMSGLHYTKSGALDMRYSSSRAAVSSGYSGGGGGGYSSSSYSTPSCSVVFVGPALHEKWRFGHALQQFSCCCSVRELRDDVQLLLDTSKQQQ
ncbi:hypothetical protein V7S43_009373 [Phytophthora oleae]|uniref:Uncharacterized protein n=1 Tax=Phytophthora oleae TaxID=2107226 RepID=A0ABD3FEX8_9STRA